MVISIREDIFPDLDGIFDSRNILLKRWVDASYDGMKDQFSSLDDFIIFLNNIKNKKDAEQFLRLCRFYNSSKNYVEYSFTKLIMMLSVIESIISSDKKYLPFKDWILGQDDLIESRLTDIKKRDIKEFKRVIQDFKEIYHSEYGSTRNVIDFFHTYMDKSDKVYIIKSFKPKKTDIVQQYSEKLYEKAPHMIGESFKELKNKGHKIRENELMPLCYNWRYCYVEYGHCHPDIYCCLMEDDELLLRYLKKVIGVIYSLRSNFVHNAKMPGIGEGGIDFSSTLYKGKHLMIELNITDFENLFEKGFIKYFENTM